MNTAFNGTAGRLTMTQESITDLPGFTKCIKLACTTADTSIAAAEYLLLSQNIEGQNLQHLAKGTSSAKKLTISFYVKGNAAATYVCEMQDNNSREISKSFSVTTSWNRVVLTFDGDTDSGGTLVNSSASGIGLIFWLHAGSNFNSGNAGDLNTSWSAAGTGTRAAGADSFFDSTSRTFFITGLQMEVGSEATPFEHRSFGDELARCERYLFQTYQYGTTAGTAVRTSSLGRYVDGAANYSSLQIPNISMRAAPTATIYSTDTASASGKIRIDTGDINGVVADVGSNGGGFVYANNVAVANQYGLRCHLVLDAEL